MTKVKKITGRGTGIREAELEDQNWAGDDYRKVQSERLKKVGKKYNCASWTRSTYCKIKRYS